MPAVTKSLRQYLQGSLVDFAESSSMGQMVSATTLTSLVVALADLREEGAVLLPEVYLCENIDKTLQLLPGSEKLEIGHQDEPLKAISQGLKKCAPLAIGGWCMYISSNGSTYQFGLFRGSLNPLSISVTQTLFSEPLNSIKVIRLFRTANGCVELRNHVGEVHSILLNDKPDSETLPHAYTTKLIDLICTKIDDDAREPTRTYLDKTLRTALAACHGTIVAVTGRKKIPSFLKDGVVLATPIDLVKAVTAIRADDTDKAAEHTLLADASLIKGMLSSDGITVFSNNGRLLAYNCFVASPNKVNGKIVIGGARTRAFEALRTKVGSELTGVFIQSQDGWTKFSGNNDD